MIPVAALVFCQPQNVDFAMVNGRILVEDGALVHVDPAPAHGVSQRSGAQSARSRRSSLDAQSSTP